jgi:hypothetical protein
MASLDTTRLDPPPVRAARPRLASSDRVACGAIAGGVLGGLAGLASGADADAVQLGVTVLGTTYAGLAGGGLLGWLAGLGRRRADAGRGGAGR